MQICISGIHTNTGKTHASAMLCKILKYDYYKLIQAGNPKDSQKILQFSPQTTIHKEGYFLKTPASPHIGKQKENAKYHGLSLPIPSAKNLIIETPGGLFCPLDEQNFVIDFLAHHKLPTFLVGKYYLGAISHLFLSLEALQKRKIQILGILLCGEEDLSISSFVKAHTNLPLLHLPFFDRENFAIAQEIFHAQFKPLIHLHSL